MKPTTHRYQAASGRSALVIADNGLTLTRGHGRPRHADWVQVRGTRWLGPGRAEVRLTDGTAIELGEEFDDLTAVLADIERAATLAHTGYRLGLDVEALVERSLDLGADGLWQCQRRTQPPPIVVLALVAATATAAMAGGPLAAGLAAVLIAVLWIGIDSLRGRSAVVASSESLTCRESGRSWTIRWRDVERLRVAPAGWGGLVEARVTSNSGVVALRGHATALAPLLRTIQEVAAANTITFRGAGDEPIPDTAISPARLDGANAGRGLSSVEP